MLRRRRRAAIASFAAAGAGMATNKQQRLTRPIVIAGVMLVAVTVAFYVGTTRPALPVGTPEAITSIAVLPFRPLVAEGRDASLELGMTDSLIMKLGTLRHVTVRPLSAVRRYTGLTQDAVEGRKGIAGGIGPGRSHPAAAGSDPSQRESAARPRRTAAVGRPVR